MPGIAVLTTAAHGLANAATAADTSVFAQVMPLTILVLLGLAIPAALLGANAVLSRLLHRTRNTNPAKEQPYESGLPVVVGGAGERFSVKFYLIAMLFLAFDIEVAFLYAWAWQFPRVEGWSLVWILLAFLVLLEIGYLYLWKKGALDWDR
jgi:NADH-quinone oxidoreductase subunit A